MGTAPASHYEGVEVATSYGDVAAEWSAFDAGVALVDARWRRFFQATGEERREFLHGQTTADVAPLAAGSGCAAASLTAQGRPLALFAIYEDGERIWIATTAAQSVATRAALSRFLVADDCEFEQDLAARAFAVAGPKAAALLASLGAEPAPGAWSLREAAIAGHPVQLFSRGDLRVPWYELLVCDADGNAGDAGAVCAALERAGAVHAGSDALEILRVESGTPRFGVDVDESRIAVEARLEWAIHFAKGCYVGQEVVERAVSRGRVNHELALLSLSGEGAHGDRVEGGGERDIVTSVARSPRLGRIALAYLPRDKADPGTRLTLLPEKMGSDPDFAGPDLVATVLEWPRARVLPGRG